MHSTNESSTFSDLNLPDALLQSIAETGYQHPSPIQSKVIPLISVGKDVIGQAQTGTGKTAAFALPLLAQIDCKERNVQALVLTPTRELALQVAQSFERYGKRVATFNVAAVYGGQSFIAQKKQLAAGAHVVVGTPGRIMDHMRRGTLNLKTLRTLVLDEADEMLRMGFAEDVEWILGQCPKKRQIALFSATMPKAIRAIAKKHLQDPTEVTLRPQNETVNAAIRQRYWFVKGTHKLDALTRILEVEDTDGVICFVRTKAASIALHNKLSARGFKSTALNGDIPQRQREEVIQQLRSGDINIVVATDVAARGIDVERVSHVFNYDMPSDTESYTHRIGRTGRAGRTGDAILFVSPREQRMLRSIERITKQKIDEMELPSAAFAHEKRMDGIVKLFSEQYKRHPKRQQVYYDLLDRMQRETGADIREIAAELARITFGQSVAVSHEKDPAEKKNTKSAGRTRRPTTGGNSRRRPSRGRNKRPPHSKRKYAQKRPRR